MKEQNYCIFILQKCCIKAGKENTELLCHAYICNAQVKGNAVQLLKLNMPGPAICLDGRLGFPGIPTEAVLSSLEEDQSVTRLNHLSHQNKKV